MTLALDAKALMAAAAFTGFDQAEPIRKVRKWKTETVTYDSGKSQRLQVWDRPIREWFINWPVLDQAARDQLVEIFDAVRGGFDTFLWLDDKEYLATGATIATDGIKTEYQLQCTYYAGKSYTWNEDRTVIVPSTIYAPVITHSVNGPQTEVSSSPGANQYTLDDLTGILIFGQAPAVGTLTCTFQYYFKVAFAEDSYDDIRFAPGPLFQATDLHIVEVL